MKIYQNPSCKTKSIYLEKCPHCKERQLDLILHEGHRIINETDPITISPSLQYTHLTKDGRYCYTHFFINNGKILKCSNQDYISKERYEELIKKWYPITRKIPY